jgi:hypothetical protein
MDEINATNETWIYLYSCSNRWMKMNYHKFKSWHQWNWQHDERYHMNEIGQMMKFCSTNEYTILDIKNQHSHLLFIYM